MLSNVSPVVSLLIVAFLIVVAILWFLLPFAVFGIKDQLKKMQKQQEGMQERIAELERHLARTAEMTEHLEKIATLTKFIAMQYKLRAEKRASDG